MHACVRTYVRLCLSRFHTNQVEGTRGGRRQARAGQGLKAKAGSTDWTRPRGATKISRRCLLCDRGLYCVLAAESDALRTRAPRPVTSPPARRPRRPDKACRCDAAAFPSRLPWSGDCACTRRAAPVVKPLVRSHACGAAVG